MRVRMVLRGSGLCVISSNCVGSRISLMANEPFNSPTVNLWLGPKDYLAFVEHLEGYRRLDGAFHELPVLSARAGYPVAALGGGDLPEVVVNFQHFKTLADGAAAWRRRFARVRPERIVLTFTDRDGATLEDLKRFDALPHPKLCFLHRPRPEIRSAVHVPGYAGDGQVGDLFTDWPRLARALTIRRLRSLLGN
jgi:uncharacterized protein (DUF1919 family)